MLPFAGAQRVKENDLARQRAVDFEKDVGRLVERAAANKAFFDQARELRDAWLSWPVRVVTLMASDLEVDDRKLVEVLTKYVRQHLDELGEPAAPELATPGRGSRGVVARGAEASTQHDRRRLGGERVDAEIMLEQETKRDDSSFQFRRFIVVA